MQAKVSVSSQGLVALPAAMLKAAGIRTQRGIIVETTAEGILLRPAEMPNEKNLILFSCHKSAPSRSF
jgi:hypothetical protein